MLLPSAFSCDASHAPPTRLQAALLASPPASPPTLSTQTAIGNIFTTCRSLQSLLTAPANPAPLPSTQLPTPPLAHAPPPLKLRLRQRRAPDGSAANEHAHITPRKKIVKRAPPRGGNKRRRTADDDMGRDDVDDNSDVESDLEISQAVAEMQDGDNIDGLGIQPPHTPKRARIAPQALPLGLERSDFHTLHLQQVADGDETAQPNLAGTDVEVEADGELWSTEDDRILVELVLDKLKLTKTEWQDCARSLGKDRNSVGRRWKSLMVNGEIGLKGRSRRGKIHGTWR